MNAVIAALTNNTPQGLHLGPDWSSRCKLSPDQRFSFHEPIWEVRRSWQVHAEVSLEGIAPDDKVRKINVLLAHAKAGRSGLVLRGANLVEDITAVLATIPMDLLVQRHDGSVVRPWVAVVLHTPPGAVLGSAFTLVDNPGLLEVNALDDALRSTTFVRITESSKCLPYHISKLEIDYSIRSKKLIQMAEIAGINVTYNPRRLMGGGSAERILQMTTKLGRGEGPVAYRRNPKSDVMTLADFAERFQKYCEISLRQLTNYHHVGHHTGNVLAEPK